jgi:hypothetical protein
MFGIKRLTDEEKAALELERKKVRLETEIRRCAEERDALKKEQLSYKTELEAL